MKVYPECIPCFLRQIYNVLRVSEAENDVSFKVLRRSAKFISDELDISRSPGHNATLLHRMFREMTKINDPYKFLKDKYTEVALGLEPEIYEKVYLPAEDRLEVAVKLAAVGNVIDFGVPRKFDIYAELENFMSRKFAYFDIEIFKRFLVPNKEVLYVADNAGEIVFDKFLLRELKERGLKVTFAVRGGPVLNDATVEDALKSGIQELVDELITTGRDFIGIDLDFASEEFREKWERAFLIISKGQANIETLENVDNKDIFFILKAKCNPMAEELMCQRNDLIFLYNKHLSELKVEGSR